MPGHTALLLEVNGVLACSKELAIYSDKVWKNMLNSPVFNTCWADVDALERIIHEQSDLRKALAFNKLLAAYSLNPADSLHPVLILETGNHIGLEKVLRENPAQLRFFPYQFHGHTLFTVHLSETQTYVLAEKDGLLFCSAFSYLVEDALSETETAGGWWARNKNIGSLTPKAALKVFARPEKWNEQQGAGLNPSMAGDIKSLAGNLSWIGLSLQGGKVQMAGESNGFFAKTGNWNGASLAQIGTVLPDNTAMLAWMGFDSGKLYFEQFNEGRQYSDFEHFCLPWIGQEAARVWLDPVSSGMKEDQFILLSTFNTQRALEMLHDFGRSRGMLVYDHSGMMEVFGFQSNSLIAPLLGDHAEAFQTPFCSVAGGYVIIAPNRHVLETVLDKYIANQTLAQQTDFLSLSASFGQQDHALFAMNGAYFPKIMDALFLHPGQSVRATAAAVGAAGWIALEMNPGFGRNVKVRASRSPLTMQPPPSDVYWKIPLRAPVAGAVTAVSQPGMSKKWRLMAQDQTSQLYCMRPDGSIDWQRKIGAPLLSEPAPVDYFKSGRFTYVFNTPQDLWLLDESGKDVGGFPVHLKANATAGVCPVDFERNNHHCYFINAENGNIYGFDDEGKSLSGWNPLQTGSKSVCPLVHFQSNGKDYLVRLGVNGQLSVFDRYGNARFPAIKLEGTFTKTPIVCLSANSFRIYCLNSQGDIFSCSPEGKVSNMGSGFSGKKPLKWTKIATENHETIAIISGNQSELFSWNGGNLSKQKIVSLPFAPDHVAGYGAMLGICSVGKRQIALSDESGHLLKGFPLAGDTKFAILELDGQMILVTGNGSAVFAYSMQQ